MKRWGGGKDPLTKCKKGGVGDEDTKQKICIEMKKEGKIWMIEVAELGIMYWEWIGGVCVSHLNRVPDEKGFMTESVADRRW